MLSNLVAGAQYCSSTHCEYHELQLEPSAFHAVRTYASTDADVVSDVTAPGTPPGEVFSPPPPPSIASLLGLNLFGLSSAAIQGGLQQQEIVQQAQDATLAELDPGEGEEEASNMLVPPETVEMA
jgi:hypothetical protein